MKNIILDRYQGRPVYTACMGDGVGQPGVAKLDANESAVTHPKVRRAIEGSLYNYYSGWAQHTTLINRIADWHGVEPDQIVLGPGASSLIHKICQLVLDSTRYSMTTTPGYDLFKFASDMTGAYAHRISLMFPDLDLDVKAVLSTIRDAGGACKLFYLARPDSPSGKVCSEVALQEIQEACDQRGMLLAVDETYMEFSEHMQGRSMLSNRVEQVDNLLVVRSFSKAAGLAGLRIGYAVVPDWMRPWFRNVTLPGEVPTPAVAAALKSMEIRQQAITDVVSGVVARREWLLSELRQLPNTMIRPLERSEANFILCRITAPIAKWTGFTLSVWLAERGVRVRYFENYRLSRYIRISIGSQEQIESARDLLREWAGAVRSV